jgi:hypothetical protein
VVDLLQAKRRIVEFRERDYIFRAKPDRQHRDIRMNPRQPRRGREP